MSALHSNRSCATAKAAIPETMSAFQAGIQATARRSTKKVSPATNRSTPSSVSFSKAVTGQKSSPRLADFKIAGAATVTPRGTLLGVGP